MAGREPNTNTAPALSIPPPLYHPSKQQRLRVGSFGMAILSHNHVVHVTLDKEEYNHASQNIASSETPPPPPPSWDNNQRIHGSSSLASAKSCLVCRNTLLLSYFNCCAVCLGIIECGRARKDESSSSPSPSHVLPIAQPPPTPARTESTTTSPSCSSSSSSSTCVNNDDDDDDDNENEKHNSNENNKPRRRRQRHCGQTFCRFTHWRPLMVVFALCELVQSLSALTLLNLALYSHDWVILRFSGLLLLQWWQIFVLPRQWHCGQSIVTGQLAACLFMVWFYVEVSKSWSWWEAFVVSTVLLKIVFPW
ncbi:hypothetical protein F4677DRAFT_460155 [Hypoxylon crocopeplum]|nr:hypothetical protein F4677DRAFT_460155 [Hypoxylon crocopeplum]